MSEHIEQVKLIRWCDFARQIYPELALMFAIPTGCLLYDGDHIMIKVGLNKAKDLKTGYTSTFTGEFPVWLVKIFE